MTGGIIRRRLLGPALLCLTAVPSADAFSPSLPPRSSRCASLPVSASVSVRGSSASNNGALFRPNCLSSLSQAHRHQQQQGSTTRTSSQLFSSKAASDSPSSSPPPRVDPIIDGAASILRRTSWLSWWTQVILTTVSSVILLFARSVAGELGVTGSAGGMKGPTGFFFGGVGLAVSVTSIFWTWGGARLSKRLLRGKTSRIQSANLLRRAITVGTSLNLAGMLVTLMGTFVIIGGLATKVLTSGGLGNIGFAAGGNAAVAQTIQPLEILVVQANANCLLSHFASMFLSLFLTRYVARLDPPSTEE